MCYIPLIDIKKECGSKYLKGVRPFFYIEDEAKVTLIPLPTPQTLKVTTNITFNPAIPAANGVAEVVAGKFYKFETSKLDGKLTIEPQGDIDAPYWKVSYETFIPGITPEKSFTLAQTAGHELICVVPDNVGNNRIIGEKGRGASLTVTEQTNDKPGYAIKLEWDCFEPPLFYTGAFA